MHSGWVGSFPVMQLGCVVHLLVDAVKTEKKDICLVIQFEMRRRYLLVDTAER